MVKRILAGLAAIILLSCQLVDTAKAAKFDEIFFAESKIYYYDARCASETAQGVLSFNGKDNLEVILKFFMQGHGLTLAQASGIAGNMIMESGLDPTIIQGGGHANPSYTPQSGVGFGLVQWTSKNRQDNMVIQILGADEARARGITVPEDKKDIKGMGLAITDINAQLNFAWIELTTEYPDTLAALKATDNPVEAAVIVHDGYERSADSRARVIEKRGGNAQQFYNERVDKEAIAGSTAPDDAIALSSTRGSTSSGSSSSSGGSACVGNEFSGGDLGATTKAYAWPEYIRPGSSTNSMPGHEGKQIRSTDMTEAYATAITKAKSEGQYTGGIRLAGIDCGGAVTRILIDSGFEPNYNFGGKTSAGAGYTGIQERWLKQNWDQISATDASDRQPGDVAINDSHTYLYVGEEIFPSKIASASLDERAPMQGHEGVTDSSFRWYRKRITPSGGEL
jgi:hypothetical protein